VGIGLNNPQFILETNGRMRVRYGSGTAGIIFMDSDNLQNRGFVGMQDNNYVGLYGFNGAGWGLTMNTNTGDINITNQLAVSHNGFSAGAFNNYSGEADYAGVEADAAVVAGNGRGIKGEGGGTGVYGISMMAGPGHRYGVEGYGRNGSGNNYGVYASAFSGNNAIAVYGSASGGTNNWGGYFSGSVYSSGTYQGSDRKLKRDIQPLNHAIELIHALKPSTYTYKTDEYEQMELPGGQQYGLIADEVKQVFPSMVKQAVQPVKYENDDRSHGRVLAPEVTFDAVNYTAMIPVLIAAMQEQQTMIEELQRKIGELEGKVMRP
jgi:Chaperone of endosialidase